MTLTENQAAAMTALIKSCLSNMGGENLADLEAHQFVWVGVDDLIDAGWGRKEAEGTFGSLIAADMVYDNFDRSFALTDDWDNLAKFHA